MNPRFVASSLKAEYVVPEEYRRRAQGSAGWGNANLRTTFEKIIRRAGLEPWPRLWHSMRASCETDLARQFPLAVVAKWLGNTQAIAMRHYVDVRDVDFELAIRREPAIGDKAAQNAAQQVSEMNGDEPQHNDAVTQKPSVLHGIATSHDTVQKHGMEVAGIETASDSGVSGRLLLRLRKMPRVPRCICAALRLPEGALPGNGRH